MAWYALDQAWVRNDESHNLEFAQRIWRSWRDGEVLRFFHELYWQRSMRPILLTPLGAGFLALSDGNLQVTRWMTSASGAMIFSFFSMRFFARKLSGMRLILALATLNSIPWVLKATIEFTGEIFALAFVLGVYASFNAYCEGGQFRRRQYFLMGLWAALAILFRPVEGGAVTLPFLLYVGWRRAAGWKYLLLGFFLPILLWYGPFVREVFFWAFEASFGRAAQATGLRQAADAWKFLSSVAPLVLGSVFTVLVGLGLPVYFWRRYKTDYAAWVVLGTGVLPLVVGAISNNGDTRYYIYSALGLIVFALQALLASPSKRWGLLVVLVGAVLSVSHAPAMLNLTSIRPWIFSPGWAHWPRSPQRREDDLVAIYDKLKAITTPVGRRKHTAACILQMHSHGPLDWVLDPWALTMMATSERSPLLYWRPSPHVYSSAQERLDNVIKRECNYVILFPLKYIPSPNGHFMSDVGEILIAARAQGALAQHAFAEIATLEVHSENERGDMVILRNQLL